MFFNYFFPNSLQNNKTLALSKLKAFADDNFSLAQMVHVLYDGIERNIGKKNKILVSHNC